MLKDLIVLTDRSQIWDMELNTPGFSSRDCTSTCHACLPALYTLPIVIAKPYFPYDWNVHISSSADRYSTLWACWYLRLSRCWQMKCLLLLNLLPAPLTIFQVWQNFSHAVPFFHWNHAWLLDGARNNSRRWTSASNSPPFDLHQPTACSQDWVEFNLRV